MPPKPGMLAVEAPEEVVALLVEGRLGERRDPVVAGIERLDDALDGAALAARVGAFEDHEERGAELARAHLAPEVQPKLEQATLRFVEPLVVLGAAQAQREVELVQASHRSVMLRSAGRPRR